jgi:hypothetical protein
MVTPGITFPNKLLSRKLFSQFVLLQESRLKGKYNLYSFNPLEGLVQWLHSTKAKTK